MNCKYIVIISLCFIFISLSCSSRQGQEMSSEPHYVSMLSLINKLEQYNEQTVIVRGHVKLGYPNIIRVNRSRSHTANDENNITLEFRPRAMTSWRRLLIHHHYCTVTGIFVYGEHDGHDEQMMIADYTNSRLFVREIVCDPEYHFSNLEDLRWSGFWLLVLDYPVSFYYLP